MLTFILTLSAVVVIGQVVYYFRGRATKLEVIAMIVAVGGLVMSELADEGMIAEAYDRIGMLVGLIGMFSATHAAARRKRDLGVGLRHDENR